VSDGLPRPLLEAIADVAADEADAERLAREWLVVTRQTQGAAERIRRAVRDARCSCMRPAQPSSEGRCSRCFGWPEKGPDL
jgi:hypothetical protein